ncbi:MAG: PKD domain-containing protein, partial [Ferruginibacter sp.]
MKNGLPIAGHPSSTNNVVIVPLPGSDSIYYVFATGAANEESQKFSYSIVNMKGDGGLGEVDPNYRNVIIEEPIFEKLAAIKHCNNKDVWIVIRKWDSDEYHSYLLTATGLNTTPVISHTGLIVNGQELNALGTLKFSAKGTKMAAIHSFANDAVELMDFDNKTGIFSNPIIFYPNPSPPAASYKGVYGAEFSPDSRLLYVTSNNSPAVASVLYQFDISSNNAATITASRQIIFQDPVLSAGALQMGPDLKIYMAVWNSNFLSAINNPDTYGAGCNFNLKEIIYRGTSTDPVLFGLPTFMQSYFDTTSNPYDFSRLPGNCLDRNIKFKINRLSGIDSVKWNFGDAQLSQALQPTHTYAVPGFYDVRLIVYKVDCSGLNDTIIRKIWIADSDKFLGADTSSCNPINLEIGVTDIFGVNYLWNTGSTSNKITISGFGDYWLDLEQNGCKIRDSIKVSPKPKPVVNLGVDTAICKYKPVVLKTGSSTYDSYLWSTGETSPSILVDQTGTYSIIVTQSGCDAKDTVVVKPGDCDIYIPSAFTPNNNNRNETFGVIDYANVQYFSM